MKNILTSTLSIIFAVLMIASCSNTTQDTSTENSEGLSLMKSYCFSCHNPTAAEDNRLAPPMFAVKRHYSGGKMKREAFVQAIVDFVNDPTSESSKMPGAVKKFGIMPKMGYDEEDVRKIAEYMYDNDLQKPDWFEAHRKKQHGVSQDTNFLKYGKELALKTKAILGKNLKVALMKGGSQYAVEFCNTRAIHITDSMATELNVSIKRVSDQNRNPNNLANETELAYILSAKTALKEGKQPKGQIQEVDGKLIGYYPIITNEMCIQCHGKEVDINEATIAKLRSLYPEDKAKGYSVNELRGIWVVEMDE